MKIKNSIIALFVCVGLASGIVGADQSKKKKQKGETPVPVTAVQASVAPMVDGDASDAVWKAAPVLNFKTVEGGVNEDQGTEGTLQVAYSGDMLYMLLTYADPTLSVRRSPFAKQADGSWKKLKDPDDKGGDNNLYYEDKVGIIWNINDSIAGFNSTYGCQIACHTGEKGKPYGNKYTEEEGELGDMWHLKAVRTVLPLGLADDQYLDHTRYDPEKAKGAGRHSDKKTGGGYTNIELVNGKPEFMNKDGKAANKGGTYWLKTEDKVPFDDSKFVTGDEVASILVSPATGDRGDIQSVAQWAEGKWTIEMARKLVTNSETDVNFSDLSKTYGFGLAIFENAQVRHSFVKAPLILSFK